MTAMTTLLSIMPIDPCGAVSKCMSSPSSYASGLNSYRTPSAKYVASHALSQLEAARARDIATHERNGPAIEANKLIVARVTALMTEIGMPVSYSERDTKSRSQYPKSIRRDSGYLGDLRRHCPIDDGFAAATHTYERLLKDYQAYAARAEEEAKEEARKQERAAEALVEKRKADMELAAVLLRYELPIDSSWSDVLEALRGRDQRLDLAVAMQQTRGDWSDGAYRVSGALGRFKIETTEDKDIANCILSCLEDFEDGRVFRDCTWSYDVLFTQATDKQLATDVCKAMGHAGDDE